MSDYFMSRIKASNSNYCGNRKVIKSCCHFILAGSMFCSLITMHSSLQTTVRAWHWQANADIGRSRSSESGEVFCSWVAAWANTEPAIWLSMIHQGITEVEFLLFCSKIQQTTSHCLFTYEGSSLYSCQCLNYREGCVYADVTPTR